MVSKRQTWARWARLTGVLAVAFLPVSSVVAEDDAALMEKGKALITEKCSRCHAIGLTGASPHAQAPPFRDVMKRYPAEDLEEALAEGIVSGHPDMPEFTFEPEQIDEIVIYLDSLREAAPE